MLNLRGVLLANNVDTRGVPNEDMETISIMQVSPGMSTFATDTTLSTP